MKIPNVDMSPRCKVCYAQMAPTVVWRGGRVRQVGYRCKCGVSVMGGPATVAEA
jgi:hypothetical protein